MLWCIAVIKIKHFSRLAFDFRCLFFSTARTLFSAGSACYSLTQQVVVFIAKTWIKLRNLGVIYQQVTVWKLIGPSTFKNLSMANKVWNMELILQKDLQ